MTRLIRPQLLHRPPQHEFLVNALSDEPKHVDFLRPIFSVQSLHVGRRVPVAIVQGNNDLQREGDTDWLGGS